MIFWGTGLRDSQQNGCFGAGLARYNGGDITNEQRWHVTKNHGGSPSVSEQTASRGPLWSGSGGIDLEHRQQDLWVRSFISAHGNHWSFVLESRANDDAHAGCDVDDDRGQTVHLRRWAEG